MLRLEIHTETLVTDIQVPQIDPEVIGRNVSLLVRVDRDGVYVVSVCVRVYFAGDSGDDVILLSHSRQS